MTSPTPPDTLLLSSLEFGRMMLESDMPTRSARVFLNHPPLTITLRHYLHITLTIQNLERELERQHIEQQQTFGHLMGSQLFRENIEPLVADYRRQALRRARRAHSSPYSRTPSPIHTPSDDRSVDPSSTPPSPAEVVIILHTDNSRSEPTPPPSSTSFYATASDEENEASPASSYVTAIDDEPGSSPHNPIDVDHLNTDVTTIRPIRDTPIPTYGVLEREGHGPNPVLRCLYCRSPDIHIFGECIHKTPRSDDSLAQQMGRNRRRPRTPQ
jgi:hypothetical protein